MPTPARLRAGTSPAPTPPAKPLYGASAAPLCGAPEVKKKMPSFLVQLEDRHRSVKQTCRWHVCSVGRSGYAARRELCGCLLFVQFKHRHECLGGNLHRTKLRIFFLPAPRKPCLSRGPPLHFTCSGGVNPPCAKGFALGETLVRRKRRPTLWGPRGQKEDAVIPRPA